MALDTSIYRRKPAVKLTSFLKGNRNRKLKPDAIVAFAAMGCFEASTSSELLRRMSKALSDRKLRKRIDSVLNNSFGRGHGAVADKSAFDFEIEGIPRIATLQLCQPQFLSHLQQSLRRVNVRNGYYLPDAFFDNPAINTGEIIAAMDSAFLLYKEMTSGGVPEEDARFVLPLLTRTNIDTLGSARELTHLHGMNDQGEIPSVTKYVVNQIIARASRVAPLLFKRREANYETLAWYPAAQLFASTNGTINRIIKEYRTPEKTVFVSFTPSAETIMKAVKERNEAELANLKHIHNGGRIEGFLAPMSLAAFHQAIRQRTWDQSVESIFDAAKRGSCRMPPKVRNSAFARQFEEQNRKMLELYFDLLAKGIPRAEAVGVVPHSLIVYGLIHVNGWNAIHSIGKRTCTEAQWEIRAIAKEIARIIRERNTALGAVVAPQGEIYGRCPERKPCGACKGISNPPEKVNIGHGT